MTQMFKLGMEIARAEDSSRKRKLIERIPASHMMEYDGKWEKTRELLQSTAIAGTNFIATETLATVIEGQKRAVCFRGLVNEYRTMSDSYNMPIGTGGGYAKKYAPGAEIMLNEDDLDTRAVTIYNYKEAVAATREMIADAKIDVIEREVQIAGERIENAINQDMLTVLLDNAGNEHDTAGSDQGYKAVIGARKLIKDDGYYPNAVVVCPQAEAKLLLDLTPTANAGSAEAIQSARLQMLGMSLSVCSVADASATYAWEYDSDGDIGMLMLDTRACGGITVREDVFIDDFEDPLKDIVGAKVEFRGGVQYAQANAISRIEY